MVEPVVYLGLDMGSRRIGVARGNNIAKLATPLAVITVDGQEMDKLRQLIEQEHAEQLVIGLPRGLDGQDTEQTRITRHATAKLTQLDLPINWQDEAGTSRQAEEEAGPKSGPLDDRAAAIILQDWLDNLKP